jgi:CxxC motif-containing protein (DUF1111 family)
MFHPRNIGLSVVSATLVALPIAAVLSSLTGEAQNVSARDSARRQRFTHDSQVDPEVVTSTSPTALRTPAATEALAAFDSLTNGFDIQGPDFDGIDENTVNPLASFNDNRFVFEEVEHADEGLGPTYNAQSCRECHQNIVTGGASQVLVQRAGHRQNGQFFDSQGGSLIHSRATYPEMMELITPADPIRALRISPSTLGDGFVEAIANSTLLNIRDRQPSLMRGTAVIVPVLEAHGRARVGRLGWKAQHASLESFAADAYLNEMGITTPILPVENTSSGRDVAPYDPTPDPEDDGVDAKAFANFMRATKAPPRGPVTPLVTTGEQLFTRIGCATCHVASITTAPAGTSINGGELTVHQALGNKVIHPYSDFLLHDVGTGDGIPIQPTAEYAATADQMKTAPLWGLRTRNRLMHDGLSVTREDAIARHGGQAIGARVLFQRLSSAEKAALMAFLDSL